MRGVRAVSARARHRRPRTRYLLSRFRECTTDRTTWRTGRTRRRHHPTNSRRARPELDEWAAAAAAAASLVQGRELRRVLSFRRAHLGQHVPPREGGLVADDLAPCDHLRQLPEPIPRDPTHMICVMYVIYVLYVICVICVRYVP